MMSFGNLQMVDVCTFEIKKFSGEVQIELFYAMLSSDLKILIQITNHLVTEE